MAFIVDYAELRTNRVMLRDIITVGLKPRCSREGGAFGGAQGRNSFVRASGHEFSARKLLLSFSFPRTFSCCETRFDGR